MSVFLTKSSVNDMFVVATPRGAQLTRSVRPTGQPWSSERALAEAIKGVPWDYHLGTIGTKMIPQAKHRAPNAVPVPAVSSEIMPPPGLPLREQVPVVPPAQSEESTVPAAMPPSVASAAPSSRPTLLLDRGDRRPVAASPMEIAGTDPPTTPGTSVDYSPSPASLPGDPVPDDTMLQDLVSQPGGDEVSSAVPPDPKRPRLLRSVMIRSARSSNSEELHHADETMELQFDAEVSESLQVHEDELNEQLHEHDEDHELTAEGIPKCLIRDLSDHEPELSTEELFEVDRQACLFEVARLGSKSVLVQVEGPLEGHRTLSTKFVLTWRQKCIGGKEVWLRRARLVAREFTFLDPHREGLFSPASSSIVTRLIPTLFMQQRANGWSMIAVDVADAYLTCSQGSPTVTSVKLGHQTLWFRLDKCLPGERDGSSRWFGDFSSYLNEHCHTEQMPQMTSILRFPAKHGAGLLHVDDLLAAGVTSVLEDCCAQLCKKYTISVQWIRDVNDQLMFLKKRHILISDGELCIQVHGKHLERLLDMTGLSKAKVRAWQSPMPTGTLPTETNDDPELPPAEASVFRSCVGILLYLQADIPEAQFCIRYLASYMSKPTKGSWAILRHLTGYLHQHKGQCQCISSSEPGQGMIVQEDGKHVVEAYSDADWAGCKVTRKSVSGSAFLVNGQLVYSASRSQRLIAVSSAESEYHAAISCAIDGLLIHAVVEFLFEGAVARECWWITRQPGP